MTREGSNLISTMIKSLGSFPDILLTQGSRGTGRLRLSIQSVRTEELPQILFLGSGGAGLSSCHPD